MARLLILACLATKCPDPDRIPALARYDGPRLRTLRTADPEGGRAKVAFLSAHYGFRDALTPIADYDARLTQDLAEQMIACGVTTRWPRPPSPRRPDTFGIHPGAEIAGLTRNGAELVDEIALVGWRLYVEVMHALVRGFVEEMGSVRRDTCVSVINGPDRPDASGSADLAGGGPLARRPAMIGYFGHNGGLAIEETADTRPSQCRHCQHWEAPSEGEQQADEAFRLGLSRRRVRRPTGACDRVSIGSSRVAAFSATVGEFGCRNYEAAPLPPMPKGGGFVTIWQNGRVAWQGREEESPARFLQEDPDL